MKILLTVVLLLVIIFFKGQDVRLTDPEGRTIEIYQGKQLMEWNPKDGLVIYDTIGTIKYLLEENRRLKNECDSLRNTDWNKKLYNAQLVW